ncbi:MAG: FAD-binding oxidoreductase [Acidimicrobiaceae bacterium]|nr:FAD-binding oxidoreductase [Acidimicrobiaceae bacterium]
MPYNLDEPWISALKELAIEIDTSSRRTAEYAYDASNYRIKPLGVVFPHNVQDVSTTLRVCNRYAVPVISRGGGTSMAGGAIGPGVILDFSRYMNRLFEVDREAKQATAEAGIVLTTLQGLVEQETRGELTFAPDPSSKSRATLGGSIANDACGNHSVRYGRTSDHIVALNLVTADGFQITATSTGLEPTMVGDKPATAKAVALSAGLRTLTERYMHEFRLELERIPRQVSGFHLANLLPERGFDVARSLAGSEGTCAVVVSAKVQLVPVQAASILLSLGYKNVVDAALDVPTILEFSPAAIEGIDEAIVDTMRRLRGHRSVQGLPEGKAWLYVDLDGEDGPALKTKADELLSRLNSNGRFVAGRIVGTEEERVSLWRVREDGAGLSARLSTGEETWPGWEDSAVAPERLADYLADLQNLLGRFGLRGLMYGHFGAGCIHVRITFDPRTPSGRATMRDFSLAAAQLVVSHGGSLSGEHGDGRARSELLSIMYSKSMIDAFASFKRLWDPSGILNPGVLVDPDPLIDNLALDGVSESQWRSNYDFALPVSSPSQIKIDPFVRAVQSCVGIGRCRSSSGGVMCPSYRVTKDEKDSTRGRSRVLQEMVRGAKNIDSTWRSGEVREALDLCLSCKACSVDCPAGVDMAAYKAEFLSHYYRHRVRPLSHYTLGWLPLWLRVTRRIAQPLNLILSSPLARPLAALGGVSTRRRLPKFASAGDLRRALVNPEETQNQPDRSDIVLVIDSFTKGFRPKAAGAAQRVLNASGNTVECNSSVCCGLTLISTGQLAAAKKVLERTVRTLDDGTDRPIVLLEPSCAACLKRDLPELVHTDAALRVSERIRCFATMIVELSEAGWRPDWKGGVPPQEVTLQVHCHEYSVFGADSQKAALRALGIKKIREATGCCGVAGNFGFEAEHFDISMDVAQLALAPALGETAEGVPVLADGFSCQMQVLQLEPERRVLHLAELLDESSPR